MKTRITFASLLPVLLLTGCVGVSPLPPSDSKTYGRVIERPQTRFIVAGQTTRAEVVAKLGGEFREAPYTAALAYSWEKPALGIGWWIITIEGGAAGYFERSHWRAFFVAFDADGKVCQRKFAHLSQGKSLDEQLEDWAQHHGAATTLTAAK